MSPLKTHFRVRSHANRRNTSSVFRSNLKKIKKLQKPKTKTNTRTKTKLNQKIKTSKDGPVSVSNFAHNMKGWKLGKFKKIISPQFYVVNKALRVTGTSGIQTGYGIIEWYNTNDLNSIFSAYTTYLNANTLGGSSATSSKIYHKRMAGELLITNQTNDVSVIKIYDCVARRDLSAAMTNYNDPWTAWVYGSTVSDVPSGSNSSQVVGSSPFQTSAFTEFYKVLKITEVDLHSGGHHRHKVTISPNRTFNYELESAIGSTLGAQFKGWCHFSMIVAHGYPDNSAATKTTVTTAQVNFDFVQKKQYEWYAVSQNKTNITYNNNLTVVNDEEIITDLTGLVTSVTSA